MLNKLGRLSLRVSNAGLSVLVCFIAERLLSAESFGQLYIILGLSVIIVGFIDFYNQKYMIDIYSRCENLLVSELLTIKLFTGLFIPFITFVICYFFDINIQLSFGIAVYVFLSVLCQAFSMALFCSKDKSRYLLKSNVVGLVSFLLVLAGYILFVNKTQLAFIFAIISYKIFEFGYYMLFFRQVCNKTNIFCSLSDVRLFIKNNRRSVFYFQWILSLLSAKSGTLILPHVVSYDDISVFAKFTIISSFVYFWLSFSASTFYSEICNVGITNQLMRRKTIEILFTFLIICFIAVGLSKYYYPVLWQYIGYILIIMVVMSITCYQGYLLFYFKLDSKVLYLSVLTLALSNVCYFLLPRYFGVKGIFISNLSVEFFSLAATMYILYSSHYKNLNVRSK